MPDQDNSPVWVKWEKKFELGIPAIDEQHRHLVGLCNQLHSEIMSRRSPDGKAWRVALSEALRETVSYTRTHFHLEEKLMAAAGYGNLPGHKNRHQEFVKTFNFCGNYFFSFFCRKPGRKQKSFSVNVTFFLCV